MDPLLNARRLFMKRMSRYGLSVALLFGAKPALAKPNNTLTGIRISQSADDHTRVVFDLTGAWAWEPLVHGPSGGSRGASESPPGLPAVRFGAFSYGPQPFGDTANDLRGRKWGCSSAPPGQTNRHRGQRVCHVMSCHARTYESAFRRHRLSRSSATITG